jgi:hypothetical protein
MSPAPPRSVPHHQVSTAPRRIVTQRAVAPEDMPPEAAASEASQGLELTPELRAAIEGATGRTVEELIGIGLKVVDASVKRTRGDTKMLVDAAVGLLGSQVSAAMTSSRTRRAQVVGGTAIGSTIAAVILAIWQFVFPAAYKSASIDAIEPAQRAEAKAVQVDKDQTVLTAKVDAVDTALAARVETNRGTLEQHEQAIAEIRTDLEANTRAVMAIAVELGVDVDGAPKPKRKGPR